MLTFCNDQNFLFVLWFLKLEKGLILNKKMEQYYCSRMCKCAHYIFSGLYTAFLEVSSHSSSFLFINLQYFYDDNMEDKCGIKKDVTEVLFFQ